MLQRCLPALQDVCRNLDQLVEVQKRAPTLIETKELYSQIKQSLNVLHQRLFVVMTAQGKGWAWAKELEFLETGNPRLLGTL